MWWRVPCQINSSWRNFCCKLFTCTLFHFSLVLFWTWVACGINVCISMHLVSLRYILTLGLLCAGNSASNHPDIRTHVYDGNRYSLEVWSSPGILISLWSRIWGFDEAQSGGTDVCWSALWILFSLKCLVYFTEPTVICNVLNFLCNIITFHVYGRLAELLQTNACVGLVLY